MRSRCRCDESAMTVRTVPALASMTRRCRHRHGQRTLAQRTHQGSERLPARHAGRGLREEITGAIVEDDQQLVKFHGMYLQDDRDLRAERTAQEDGEGVRLHDPRAHPGRRAHARAVARARRASRATTATARMRITTRQTFQFHGVIKSNLKATMRAIDAALLDTIAACGDVNRNVMCNPNPHQSRAHRGGHATRARRSPITCCRARRPIARSGSTARRSPAARRR